DLDDRNRPPSDTMRDGVDYLPAPATVLFGHHFSSIAGAGPVLGPIIAALAFGWLPVWLWVVVGAIFIGGVHDFSSLVISIRNRGRSIAEIANIYMSKRSYRLMLVFIWFTLVYIITVFADLAAAAFASDGGVASSSCIFIVLAVAFGLSLYRLRIPLLPATIIFVPLLFFSVWFGQAIPLNAMPPLFGSSVNTWSALLIVYCFIASVAPVWILLQPRDYLSSFLLYASVLGGSLGIIFGGFDLKYPVFTGYSSSSLGPIFPLLFVTVACGAISGFHSIVASGTSSKQIRKETDSLPIGYGAMLVEGLVAVVALSTVMVIGAGSPLSRSDPLAVYGAGMAKFLSIFGIPEKYGGSLGILALSTFILTTLDTATRLSRYVFQEFFSLKNKADRFIATAATLVLPTVLVLTDIKDAQGNVIPAWKSIWPVFGSANQLLAGLALMIAGLWLRKKGKPSWFVLLPMIFMLVTAFSALCDTVLRYRFGILGLVGAVLLFLSFLLVLEAARIFLPAAEKRI
ncbi:MAG: carbon starvation protein A, partial [Candidatus Omnitrophica bacterium]|nr:carbon starvation protein A [Candidatus Omnitrophota bacterium]